MLFTLPLNIPGVDRSKALEQCASNEGLACHILSEMAQRLADDEQLGLELIQSTPIALKALSELAHKHRGIAGNIGATDIYNTLSKMDDLIKLGTSEKAMVTEQWNKAVNCAKAITSVFR